MDNNNPAVKKSPSTKRLNLVNTLIAIGSATNGIFKLGESAKRLGDMRKSSGQVNTYSGVKLPKGHAKKKAARKAMQKASRRANRS